MSLRHGIALILAVLVGAAMAAVAEGQDQGSETAVGVATATPASVSSPQATPQTTSVPSNERTDPQIHPTSGSGLTVFTLTFTLRDAPGHEGVMATEYRVQVAAPPGSRSSCMAAQPPAIDSGTAGALEQITLTPPAGGWCGGIYLVSVFLQRGPYCPTPVEGQQPIPCPEFADPGARHRFDHLYGRLKRSLGLCAEPQGSKASRRQSSPETATSQGALHGSQQPMRWQSTPRADHLAGTNCGHEGASRLKGASPDQLRYLIAISAETRWVSKVMQPSGLFAEP